MIEEEIMRSINVRKRSISACLCLCSLLAPLVCVMFSCVEFFNCVNFLNRDEFFNALILLPNIWPTVNFELILLPNIWPTVNFELILLPNIWPTVNFELILRLILS